MGRKLGKRKCAVPRPPLFRVGSDELYKPAGGRAWEVPACHDPFACLLLFGPRGGRRG